ncbi:ABC transporter ATP-binding protein [Paracoccus aerius]|uniref:ABC transporter ATP-binding protein n=1 Tax=Paracoccus aerius TaxID=1915382 RepID=A0ABS1S9C8_9RHOB|nr:ABC transporter ATP-binding protein [Paracoccus aerius]MBL3675298.1 ABC transporter ATP-binding protein [Paracoccus aerius]GHG20927.1 ABC transporter ATP-binding protein [Paracoccus aerius]
MSAPLLNVESLCVEFGPKSAPIRVINSVNLRVDAGEAVGIVGESGSGKSITSLSILRLVPEPPSRIASGRIEFEGRDLLAMPKSQLRHMRGRDIAMIFQEPMSSLNPVMTVEAQIGEAIMLHQRLGRAERRARVIELLRLVGIPDPESRLKAYPHQFSGGMRQRVMIAIAVACNPKLLIADEPTTALDVTIQAQVLDLMKDVRRKLNTAILLISHDLGVIAEVCERVLVMYAGHVVEDADIRSLFENPQHPYTRGLLRAVPSLTDEHPRLYQIPGSVPQAGSIRQGCPFYARCDLRQDICARAMPAMSTHGARHVAACWATQSMPEVRSA